MKTEILAVALMALVAGSVYFSAKTESSNSFDEWKAQYGANWDSNEEQYRKMIFEKNLVIINKHNTDDSQTYKMGINQFTAMTDDEFAQIYLDPKPAVSFVDNEEPIVTADVDWVSKGGVSPIKNQGACGSCWAFSATGVLESWSKIKKGQSVSLSEQQLVDCSRSYGNQGCNGGWPSSALKFVKDHGITTESAYAYTAKDGTCKATTGSFKISGYNNNSGCNGLSSALQSMPVSVTVDATNWSKYSSGVFSNCGTGINHAVLLVGATGSNWKIKNSWGSGWGESGFIRLSLGNTCGVCAYAGVTPA